MVTTNVTYITGQPYSTTVAAGNDVEVKLLSEDGTPGVVCTVGVTGTTITGNVYYSVAPDPQGSDRWILAEGGALTAVDSAGFSFDTQITGIKIEATTNTHTVDIIG